MSGGSWEYVYEKFAEVASRLSTSRDDPYRLALGKLVEGVSEAMMAVEWVDSGDYSMGDEVPQIMKVVSRAEVLEAARDQLLATIATARRVADDMAAPEKRYVFRVGSDGVPQPVEIHNPGKPDG